MNNIAFRYVYQEIQTKKIKIVRFSFLNVYNGIARKHTNGMCNHRLLTVDRDTLTKDKSGKTIFENDILNDGENDFVAVLDEDFGFYKAAPIDEEGVIIQGACKQVDDFPMMEITGNIHKI